MTPRRRSSRKAGWPTNLYESRGYYTYRNPKSGEVFGLGRDKASAFQQAVEANLHLAGQLRKERLVDRIQGTAGRTVAEWITKYEQILSERTLSVNTRKAYRSLSRKMVALLGADTKLREVTALMVADGLDAIVKSGRGQTAKALKGFLRESFATAAVKGWRDEHDNPVREVKSEPVKVRRARLTWEIFQQVRDQADPWLRNAMELSLVSGQSRAEIAAAQFRQVHDGCWWVERGKTDARICLPLELRLDVLGKTLDDVVKQCRSTGILSHYLIHQTEHVGRNRPGRPLKPDTLSIKFSTVIASRGAIFEGKDPPTFHEIRSLAARLYKAQGNVNTQELLGHKSAKTTVIYEDGRGEWIRVRVTV